MSKSLKGLSRSDMRSLALELGLFQTTVDDHPPMFTGDELRCALITDWINGKDSVCDQEHGGATWNSLLKCLRELDHNGIAKKIEEQQPAGIPIVCV